MQARTKSPIYARLDYSDGDVIIGLTDPWHGRIKQCVGGLKSLKNLPLSLRTSSVAGKALTGLGAAIDSITFMVGGLVIEFRLYEVAHWVAEGVVTLVKDAFVSAPTANMTIESPPIVDRG
ncbi:hypothetical protein [Natrinema sp. H-ect4]|uniref:hypothetical protein n=1 Tax=Natrinema sp. H-ect4 TaxID=3242699 RepID=UPI0035A99688